MLQSHCPLNTFQQSLFLSDADELILALSPIMASLGRLDHSAVDGRDSSSQGQDGCSISFSIGVGKQTCFGFDMMLWWEHFHRYCHLQASGFCYVPYKSQHLSNVGLVNVLPPPHVAEGVHISGRSCPNRAQVFLKFGIWTVVTKLSSRGQHLSFIQPMCSVCFGLLATYLEPLDEF